MKNFCIALALAATFATGSMAMAQTEIHNSQYSHQSGSSYSYGPGGYQTNSYASQNQRQYGGVMGHPPGGMHGQTYDISNGRSSATSFGHDKNGYHYSGHNIASGNHRVMDLSRTFTPYGGMPINRPAQCRRLSAGPDR